MYAVAPIENNDKSIEWKALIDLSVGI